MRLQFVFVMNKYNICVRLNDFYGLNATTVSFSTHSGRRITLIWITTSQIQPQLPYVPHVGKADSRCYDICENVEDVYRELLTCSQYATE